MMIGEKPSLDEPSKIESLEEGEHDQLPSPEEIKAQHGYRSSQGSIQASPRKVGIAICLMVVLSTILIAVGVSIGRGDSQQNTGQSNNNYDGTSNPVTPSFPVQPSSRFDSVANYVSLQGWSDATIVNQPGSPQNTAVKWIADDDPMQLLIDNTSRFRERYALAVFHASLSMTDNWMYELKFMTGDEACDWYSTFYNNAEPGYETVRVGVECGDKMTVTTLTFPGIGLNGNLPSEIRLLYDLETLNLQENHIYSLPSELTELSTLKNLDASSNKLGGHIPDWIGDMATLEKLDLGGNLYIGDLPPALGRLSNIQILNLEGNMLVGSLFNVQGLQTLQALFLGGNDLSGILSNDALNSWNNLQVLDLSRNWLTGTLPSEMFVRGLYVLDLHSNRFMGQVSSFDGHDSDLEYLDLQDNNFNGTLPIETIFAMLHLEHLDLAKNKFEGTIPESLGNITQLRYLSLAFNENLTPGTIPTMFGQLTNLEDLSLQNTNRKGPIPTEFGNLKQLDLLDLNLNNLTGYIPDSLGALSNLKFLFLKDNELSGIIPEAMAGMKLLDTLLIEQNGIAGNANPICNPKLPAITTFVADCTIRNCTCCSSCCQAGDDTCDNIVWYDVTNNMGEYLKDQKFYKFHKDDLVIADIDYGELYNGDSGGGGEGNGWNSTDGGAGGFTSEGAGFNNGPGSDGTNFVEGNDPGTGGDSTATYPPAGWGYSGDGFDEGDYFGDGTDDPYP